MKKNSIVVAAGCLALSFGLAGCAKPRTEPFDVPSGVSRVSLPASRESGRSDAVNRAAGEIAAATIYFAFDRAEIRADAAATLERVAALLKENPSIRIALQGHCDERGGEEYNYGLGERRARAAYGALLRAGVPASQLAMVNYGEKAPAIAGRTEAAYSRNRRVAFHVLTTCL